jgi:hypothetical protein
LRQGHYGAAGVDLEGRRHGVERCVVKLCRSRCCVRNRKQQTDKSWRASPRALPVLHQGTAGGQEAVSRCGSCWNLETDPGWLIMTCAAGTSNMPYSSR